MKMSGALEERPAGKLMSKHWLNRTVLGIGLASLLSDTSHEIATTILPAFLATMGAAAELVDKERHGMRFGVLATVNGVGDFLSSLVVGILWTTLGTPVAFAYSTVLFVAGATLVWRSR